MICPKDLNLIWQHGNFQLWIKNTCHSQSIDPICSNSLIPGGLRIFSLRDQFYRLIIGLENVVVMKVLVLLGSSCQLSLFFWEKTGTVKEDLQGMTCILMQILDSKTPGVSWSEIVQEFTLWLIVQQFFNIQSSVVLLSCNPQPIHSPQKTSLEMASMVPIRRGGGTYFYGYHIGETTPKSWDMGPQLEVHFHGYHGSFITFWNDGTRISLLWSWSNQGDCVGSAKMGIRVSPNSGTFSQLRQTFHHGDSQQTQFHGGERNWAIARWIISQQESAPVSACKSHRSQYGYTTNTHGISQWELIYFSIEY